MQADEIHQALDGLQIETPSWAYSDTGTRFGKFRQDAAAVDVWDRLADAAETHRLTGCCPTVAVHTAWDLADDIDPRRLLEYAAERGIRIGSVNPTLFEEQQYKLGSLANPDPDVRRSAVAHVLRSIALAKTLGSRTISLWLADGTNYPGQDSIRLRKQRIAHALRQCHEHLAADQTLLVEYKPFEPAFYHTDIADWGMACLLARHAGPRAKVLIDTGHHYAAQNVEQIVAWLLDERLLGGFHFNDRRYADDDLTLGSIDPFQLFRIFLEIHNYAADHAGQHPDIAYMVDQAHNVKPKVEAMIQSVVTAQELYAKAALVDHAELAELRQRGNIIGAESLLKSAFFADVQPAITSWREHRGLPNDPMKAHRHSGYSEATARERSARRKRSGSHYGNGYT